MKMSMVILIVVVALVIPVTSFGLLKDDPTATKDIKAYVSVLKDRAILLAHSTQVSKGEIEIIFSEYENCVLNIEHGDKDAYLQCTIDMQFRLRRAENE